MLKQALRHLHGESGTRASTSPCQQLWPANALASAFISIPLSHYSVLSARTGSIDAARRAGM
jgi:hypothetical protein